MPSLVRFSSPRVAEVVPDAERTPQPDEVLIRTLYSGISAGTELTAYRGSNPYLNKRWNDDSRLFVDGDTSISYPVDGWGYEEVGEVVSLGAAAEGVTVGDVVWGTWGHRSHTVKKATWAAQRILNTAVDPRVGIFSQIGAIALNLVLDADIHVGETVAVFGLGVPGQLAAQLARLNGGRVIAVDGLPARRQLALDLGADVALDPADGETAERIRDLTEGRGADVCLEVSGSYHALHEAVRSVAYSSRVCVAGFMQGEGAGLRLGEEFHHNRVALTCSQISGVAPALQHRWNYDRLARTAIQLASDKRLNVTDLITHTVPMVQAADAFRMLDERPQEALQVVLSFDEGVTA